MKQPVSHADLPMEPRARETQEIVGSRVRELRKAKRMTLRDLAEATGLSVGYLSQLELDKAVPSIRALSGIARALSVNVSWFFPDDTGNQAEGSVVVRAGARRALRFESGIKDELLCPTLSGKLEMLLCTFDPGADSGGAYAHDGEEVGYVSEGRLELTVENEVYLLETGDSFQLDCNRLHSYRNPAADQRTVVVWCVTPPHY